MKPRTSTALILTIALILIAAFSGRVQSQTTYTQYKIQLNSDNSATWIITQVSGINGTVDTWGGFEQKVTSIISAATDQTSRQMIVDNSSFQMSTTSLSSNSKSTSYTFTWLDFSVTRHGQLVTGDVFGVNGFFNQLYGDGELQINYPANYTLQSVAPTPDQKDTSTQTLTWLGTQFFVTETPQIILQPQGTTKTDSAQSSPFLLLSVSVIAVVAGVVAAWFLFVNRRRKIRATAALPTLTLPESEEDKVLRVLRSNSGGLYQTAITEQCRFSKAKTSQLLSALEREGKVRRVKKGRDKIVNLVEQSKAKNNAG
ncbi:MAG: hypothetical protein ABSE15_07020 [Candidatus Bathyarchaeia archaeon]